MASDGHSGKPAFTIPGTSLSPIPGLFAPLPAVSVFRHTTFLNNLKTPNSFRLFNHSSQFQRTIPPLIATTRANAQKGPPITARFEDNGSIQQTIPEFIHATSDDSVGGVYATESEHGQVTYIGMSRDIAASLEAHACAHPEDVHTVRVHTVFPASAPAMARIAASWLSNLEYTPIGNSEHWFEVDQALAAASDTKIQTVTMENPSDNTSTDFQQNRSAQYNPPAVPPISPFASDPLKKNSNSLHDRHPTTAAFTKGGVDMVLNEVRPYLISDGGNISVVNVNSTTGVIQLRLEGACVSCESSATTMHLGVEKTLRAAFGSQISNVVVIDEPAWSDIVSVDKCQQAIQSIEGILNAFGASVHLVEVDEDEVILAFNGPASMKVAVERVIREKVPGVAAVTFE